MLCYKDMTFCLRKCANITCRKNRINIDPFHVEEVGLPIAWSKFENCKDFKEVKYGN